MLKAPHLMDHHHDQSGQRCCPSKTSSCSLTCTSILRIHRSTFCRRCRRRTTRFLRGGVLVWLLGGHYRIGIRAAHSSLCIMHTMATLDNFRPCRAFWCGRQNGHEYSLPGHFARVVMQPLMIVSHFQGFDADHKDIALLRLKNFTLHRKLEDSEVTDPNAVGFIVGLISQLVPFVSATSHYYFYSLAVVGSSTVTVLGKNFMGPKVARGMQSDSTLVIWPSHMSLGCNSKCRCVTYKVLH